MTSPDLAMPWPAWYELDGEMPATVALHVKPDVLPSQLPLYMQDITKGSVWRSQGSEQASATNLSVYLEPLDRRTDGRELQIRDLRMHRLAPAPMPSASTSVFRSPSLRRMMDCTRSRRSC